MIKYLVVGLGNIGPEYAHTRHNIGFDIIDAFAKKHGVLFQASRLAELGMAKIKGKAVFCIKPATYMNLSGKAVKYWMEKENIAIENILVVVDEIALPLEKLRIRPGGSAGGHNGLKSIEELLQTTEYPRLRVGIGNNYPKGQQAAYVLGKWEPLEEPLVARKIEICVSAVECFVTQGLTNTMNEFNKITVTL
jgi:peptidyl-tRNA hydrolase, PTH1 family